MVELEIDGQKVKAEEGASIIEAADDANIYIPRFCYHKKLSIAANCRMCLVEVEKVGKPVPACATPVTPDMKVFTQSQKALDAQRDVMEFLLINHPLDCPICDQGGQCELQDLSMGYGRPYSYFDERKRSIYSDNIGPLIETWMTRCIHCTRCVRFGEEVAGLRELGVTYRGEKEQISTYVKHFLKSEMSGNIIDICPVGALTEKPSRYEARGWEVREHPSIAPHDCVGSNIFVHSFFQEYAPQRPVKRVVPRENEKINEVWISDRDRFSYQALYHKDRIYKPRVKTNNTWQEVSWEEALKTVLERTQKCLNQHGVENLAALGSPNSTVEEFYLLQKFIRGLGSNNVDHRIHQHDFRNQAHTPEFPNMGMNITDIDDLDAILLVGSNVRYEQPLIAHHINLAFQNDAKVMVVNPVEYAFAFDVAEKIINHDILFNLAEVAKALADDANNKVDALNGITPSDTAKAIAQQLKTAERAGIFLGEFAIDHPQFTDIAMLVRLINELSGANIGVLTHGANSSGAWLAGMVPHRAAANASIEPPGKDAKALLTTDAVRAYFLLNIEPEFDTAYPAAAIQALSNAEVVVSLSTFVTPKLEQVADIILPVTPFTETAGTFVNVEGTWQSFSAVSVPMEDAKPAWKVLRVLGNFFKLDGFEFQTAHAVRDELQRQVENIPAYQPPQIKIEKIKSDATHLMRLANWPIYRTDSLVRRAKSLQEVQLEMENDLISIRVNATTANHLNLTDGMSVVATQKDQQVALPLKIDRRLADNIVLLPAGLEQTSAFGETMAEIKLQQEA